MKQQFFLRIDEMNIVHCHCTSRGLVKNVTGVWRVSKTNDAVIFRTEYFKGIVDFE